MKPSRRTAGVPASAAARRAFRRHPSDDYAAADSGWDCRPRPRPCFRAPQRHGDHVTRRELKTRRHAVRIGLVERHRHQNIDNSAHTAMLAVWPIPARLRKGEGSSATRSNHERICRPSSDVVGRDRPLAGLSRRRAAHVTENASSAIGATYAQFLGFLTEHLGGAADTETNCQTHASRYSRFHGVQAQPGNRQSILDASALLASGLFARFLERKGKGKVAALSAVRTPSFEELAESRSRDVRRRADYRRRIRRKARPVRRGFSHATPRCWLCFMAPVCACLRRSVSKRRDIRR